MNTIPVALLGASGRLGRLIDSLITTRYNDQLSVVARPGRDGDLSALDGADIVIDVSLPEGTERLVNWLESAGSQPATVVSGTTGIEASLLNRMLAQGKSRKVLHATNFSAGIATLNHILRQAAPILESLGYTAVITDIHHRHKKDAPSGTALTLAESLAPFQDVETHSIRAGEVPGTHEVTFFGDHDQLAVRHEARDRGAFAVGAVEAALWLHALRQTGAAFTAESYFEARLAASNVSVG